MPNLNQMLMASIYGFVNDKCKDFKAAVTRVAHIEKVSTDVAERSGKRSDEVTLANIFYLSMDHTSITELVHYRVGPGPDARLINLDKYSELRGYVQVRGARERSLAPIPAKKMEVGSFAKLWPCRGSRGARALWMIWGTPTLRTVR